ncbi:MAG: aldo/keto reductase [Acidobacteria bacterium]|nr:MAG: aldo/keto reductase [Acidobacteriota bacterium]
MEAFPERVLLGRSGLSVSPLGLAGGYGVGKDALLKAFSRGINYWYHGTRRTGGMRDAIRELVRGGRRDELVVVVQTYARFGWLVERSVGRALRSLGLDHADVLLLGLFNRTPKDSIMDRVERMREKGMFRQLAVSAHRRPSFVTYAADPRFSILHIRYNAAHTGAERDIFPHLPAGTRPGTVAYTATRWRGLLKAGEMPPGEKPLRGRDCYRFVLSNPDFNVCMAGPSNESQLEEALAALEEGPLSPEENERFRRIGRHVHERAIIGK